MKKSDRIPFDSIMQMHYPEDSVCIIVLPVMSDSSIPCSESTLTDRYQTTIPAPIRNVLGLQKGDKLSYSIQPEGQVVISRVESTESDPILEKFLDFLAQDMAENPHHLQPLNAALVKRVQSLVADVEVDLDAPLNDEDE